MRVAYVCADPGVPVWGTKGASAHVRGVVRALRQRGATVTLFAARTGNAAPSDLADVDVVGLPGARGGPVAQRERMALAANDRLRAALTSHGPFDLVYERYALWSFAGMAYARASAATGTRSLLEVNAPLVDEQARHRSLHDRGTAERIARRVLGLADGVLAVSDEVAAWARGLGADAVTVVPNGVDVHRPTAVGAVPSPPPGPQGYTVAFTGSLKPWHGVEVLVQAVRRLAADEAAPPARLLLIGDGPERSAVERLLDRLRLRGLTTLTGAIDPDDVPGWLARAQVGAAPYPPDAATYFSPLKVLDYLGAGLPVVGSDVGQIPALLDGQRAGILVPAGDVAALADGLRRLRDAPALRVRLGSHGRALAVSRHSWDGVVARALAAVGLDGFAPVPAARTAPAPAAREAH